MTAISSVQPEIAYGAAVIDTLRASGLEQADMLVLGGAVLAIEGIRPAHDVDILVRRHLFCILERERAIRGSAEPIPVTRKYGRGPRLHAPRGANGMPLALDINSVYPTPTEERICEAMFERADVTPEGFLHVPLATVREIKRSSWLPKDRADVALIDRTVHARGARMLRTRP